jgi:hypothetical protein
MWTCNGKIVEAVRFWYRLRIAGLGCCRGALIVLNIDDTQGCLLNMSMDDAYYSFLNIVEVLRKDRKQASKMQCLCLFISICTVYFDTVVVLTVIDSIVSEGAVLCMGVT